MLSSLCPAMAAILSVSRFFGAIQGAEAPAQPG